MHQKHLATYLNDHLAGSVTVLELLSHVASAYAGTDTATFVADLHEEILADRRTLEELMKQLNVGQSATRKTSAWLAEKFAQMKLKMDDSAAGAFRLTEAMEAVSIGIEGKRLLWVALGSLSEVESALRGPNYSELEHRAADQRIRVETVRVTAAKSALLASSG